MDKIWAPWRINYFKIKKQKGCIFCKAKKNNAGDYVIFKSKHCLGLLNIYPYACGHIMIAPLRHINSLGQLNQQEVMDIFAALKKIQLALDKVLKPQGYNIGLNLSRSSGAGITGHMHIHIVPRWIGDANFMTTISDTRVISQSLGQLRKELLKYVRP
ncbi:MAG: HIT domain-containing protein [Candidatus Omnitrophica bacterium]|nr:HIT domain-containing protein [Candidatus Omnitrophota bacterium]